MAFLIKSFARILPALTSSLPLIYLIFFLCSLTNAKDEYNFTDSGMGLPLQFEDGSNFPLERFKRQPQGRDAPPLTLIATPIKNASNYSPTEPLEGGEGFGGLGNHKSRFKKKGIVLTLNLREPMMGREDLLVRGSPSHQVTITPGPLDNDEIVVTKAISSEVPSSTIKAYKILDRLSKLTNIKLKSAAIVNSGTNFGLKNRFKQPRRQSRAEEEPGTETTENFELVKGPTIFGSFSPEDSQKAKTLNVPTTPSPSPLIAGPISKPEIGKSQSSKQSKVGGHISLGTKEKQEILDKMERAKLRLGSKVAGNLNLEKNDNLEAESSTENAPHGEEHIKSQESRVITADQIGGNRPTRVPFHFTTTTTPPYIPTTTTETRTRPQVRRYNSNNQKLHSPHNHIYAPTQDPIAVAHNEDLNVEDFQDFRAANLNFGSKVGAEVSTIPPSSESSINEPIGHSHGRPALPVRNLRQKAKITIQPPAPTTTTTSAPYRDSAQSGQKSSHINPRSPGGQKRTNNINEQLPFYKEPGGIFEHPKYSNSQIESNEIQFDEKIPGVKYAPKGPSAQPQTNVYSSPRQQVSEQQQHHQQQQQQQHHHQPQHYQQQLPILPPPQPTQPLPSPPQYVQVTQQPIYLSPVPIQQTQGYGPIPQNNYYHQPVAALPVQVPTPYYPPPPQQPPPQIYNHNHHNQQQQHGGFVPVIQNYQPQAQHQPQPIPAPPVYTHQQKPPGRNAYYIPPNRLPGQEDEDAYYHDTDRRPPARHDPDSDDFYGNPIAVPPKPQPTKLKPAKKPSGRTPRPEPNYDDEPPSYEPPRNRDRDRGSSRERNRYNDDRYEPAKPPPPPPARRTPQSRRTYESSPSSSSRIRDPPESPPDYDDSDYDTDPNENIDEIVRPSQPASQPQRQRPTYQDPQRQFVNLDDNFQQPPTPFYKPSQEDYRRIPGAVGSPNSPSFEHPNIHFNNNRRPPTGPSSSRGNGGGYRDGRRGPDDDEEDQGSTGNGEYGESTDRSLPLLDPIYTRTIKQFDEELARQSRPQQNQNRNQNQNQEDDDDHYSPAQNSRPQNEPEEYPRQQSQARRRYPQDDQREREEEPENEEKEEKEEKEEEEEERPNPNERGREKEREQPAEEEEEEEEETKAVPQKKGAEPEQEEEEEEEEEQEDEKPKKQERGRKEKKKRPPKDQKSGNLDDDIIGIEREFGNYEANPHRQHGNVQYHPVLGRR